MVDVQPPGMNRFGHHVVRLFRVTAAAVIDAADRVLMLHRYRFVPDAVGWELPGGIVEAGEDAVNAARGGGRLAGFPGRSSNCSTSDGRGIRTGFLQAAARAPGGRAGLAGDRGHLR
jgi:8-oxo-dGTP pyrophosphatase MutT (NUDIX family)